MKQVSPKIDDQVHAWYVRLFDTPNQGVSYVLEAFPTLYARTLSELRGKFIQAELSLILDVLNGLLLTPQFAGQHLQGSVTDAIAIEGIDRKWGVTATTLLEKISRLTLTQVAVLEIWAKGFWAQVDKKIAIEDWSRPLLPLETGKDQPHGE